MAFGDTELAACARSSGPAGTTGSTKSWTSCGGRGSASTWPEVETLAGGEAIARPHFAQVLVKRGYAFTNREAFDRWLDTEEFRPKVKRFKADARTCVEAIHAAGGKVSLAHPYQMGLPDDELEALVGQFKGWALDAIECSYPIYTVEQQKFYLRLAEKYQLHRTGGNDFHGERVKPDVKLAALDLELDWLLAD